MGSHGIKQHLEAFFPSSRNCCSCLVWTAAVACVGVKMWRLVVSRGGHSPQRLVSGQDGRRRDDIDRCPNYLQADKSGGYFCK